MVKQYVGARYVPKFASPIEWAADTSYEALTIVTFNNASYTSKVTVPPTVGNPANNPQYWALTGNYNAQVEQYRQETETVNNNLTTEITNRENADTALQNQIATEVTNRENADTALHKQVEQYRQETETVSNNLTTEITNRENADTALQNQIATALHKQVNKYYLFIGDSYAVESVTGTNRWPISLAKLLKLNDNQYTISAQGSTGFIGVTTNTWLDLLKNANVTNRESVTDIIVAGGSNDSGVSDTNSLVSAISKFMSEAKKLYPNAKVYLANIMYAKNISTRNSAFYKIDLYYPTIENYGGIYLSNTWKCLFDTSLLQDDGIHPIYNGVANERIAQAIYNALNGGYYPVPIYRNLELTNANDVTDVSDISIYEFCQNETLGWYIYGTATTIPDSFYVGFNAEKNIAIMTKIADTNTMLPSPGGAYVSTPCCIIPRVNAPTHIAIGGRLIMSSGALWFQIDPQSTDAEFNPAVNCTAVNIRPYHNIVLSI